MFGHSSNANHTCPVVAKTDPVQSSMADGFSFHDLSVIVSGACTGFACLLSFYLIMRHATHFSIPREQKQIIRVVFTIPVLAIVSFLSVVAKDAAIYLNPIEGLYEAFAFASLFTLLAEFVHEDDYARESLFAKKGKNYTAITIGVFQFPVVMVVVFLATEIAEATGTYCAASNKIYFAHIWTTLFTIVSIAIAVLSVFRFYRASKVEIRHRHPVSKFALFKCIIFLNLTQTAIFSLLSSSSKINPTNYITYNDLTVAVPGMLVCAEMVIFSLGFLYVYRVSEYANKPVGEINTVPLGQGGYNGGFLGINALFQAINIVDLLRGIFSVPGKLANRGRSGAPVSEWSARG
jgi:hypothetical protein